MERQAHRGAFTLVEALVALLIGSALLAASGAVVVQAFTVRRATDAALERRWRAARAFDQFELDVGTELTWLAGSVPTIQVGEHPSTDLTILGLAAGRHGKSPHSRRLPAQIRYFVQTTQNADGDALSLIREVRFLHAPDDKPAREVVCSELSFAKFQYFVADSWSDDTGQNDRGVRRPLALRLACAWRDEPAALSRTVALRTFPDRGGNQR